MECKKCGKEFDIVEIGKGKDYDRGDGVRYGNVSYSYKPICPHCGFDNSEMKAILKKD